jgi:hypothetical protein
MLVDLKEMEIKKLSEIYDPGSRESFVSLYMNLEKTNEGYHPDSSGYSSKCITY